MHGVGMVNYGHGWGLLQMGFDGFFIEFFGFSRFNDDSALGAFSQTCAETVAVFVTCKLRFSVDDFEGTLGARGDT